MAQSTPIATALPGTRVAARGLSWEVVHVEPAGEQQRFRLRCLDGALRGDEVDLLSPFEPITPIATELDPRRAARLGEWRLYHQAFLLEQSFGTQALSAVQPGRLDLVPYQLVPVLRALEMSRPRLLLADGVGLGKTVEAGLVMAELIARRRAHRILIVSPAGPLLQQWRSEMRQRFGLRFRELDRATLQEIRYASELGANPFDHVALGLISIDFAKQEKVLQDLERSVFDLVVIDEAHHCASLGTAANREDSLRRRLAEVLARQTDGLLLLTATPHDGYDPHFASLAELLDPSLVDGRGTLRGDAYRRHVIRRLKRHIKDPATGQDLFKKRRVEPRQVSFDESTHPRFSALQRALLALVAPRLRQAASRRRYDEVLAFLALLKRSVSTALACRKTLHAIANRYRELLDRGAEDQEERRQRLRTLRDYRGRLERYGSLSFEEEQDQAELEAEDMAAEIFTAGADELLEELAVGGRQVRRERDRLRRLEETLDGLQQLEKLAEAAITEDPKLAGVLAEVRTIRAGEPRANVLVYTEYTDSQDAVAEHLRQALEAGKIDGHVLTLSGLDNEKDRETACGRFSQEDGLILVSTDASAEGLNLQERCHHLIHLELPYNPNRIEQRNGRIDRYGQKREPRIAYLYLPGTFEERLLLRLVGKFERQRRRLTFVPNTLGLFADDAAPSTVRLLEGLGEEQGRLFERPQQQIRFADDADDTPEEGDPAYRELLVEVDRAMRRFDRAAKTELWLGDAGLNAEPHQAAKADAARRAGEDLGEVDLLAFVRAAVEAEGGRARPLEDGVWELRLTGTWIHGLEDLPGWDADHGLLRLAADAGRTEDGEGRSVGFLGRAHPLVRRAIERVRQQQLGGGRELLDRRVSAAAFDGDEPELLVTCLATVESDAGRELERVLAVRVRRKGEPAVQLDAGWLELAAPDRQVATAGIWERHFAGWGNERRHEAPAAAEAAFAEVAAAFLTEHRRNLEAERRDLDEWLRSRSDALCGPPEVRQAGLFDTEEALPAWQSADDPLARLAAFATDGAQSPARRREARGVVALAKQRFAEIERRERTRLPEPTVLGLLMLLPQTGGRRP